MPRGRPRKTAEPEVLPPEDSQSPNKQIREVKHKTEWVELRQVEGAPEDTELELEEVEIEDKPKRKTKSEREELQELLAQHNITPASQLRLFVERYVHSESAVGGVWAEKEFLTRYTCTKEHITSEDYLDVARKWGPGTYWFTLRMIQTGKKAGTRVVASWERRLGGAPNSPMVQNVNPNDPTSPQVIVNMPDNGQPVGVVDPWKQMRELAKTYKELKQTFEPEGTQPAQNPARTEEEVLTSAILKQPEMIENVVGSVMKRFGSRGGDDGGDKWADVAMEAVKNGQASQIVRELINGLFNGFGSFFPGRQQNGQAQVATAPLQNQGGSGADRNPSAQEFPQSQESLPQGVNTGLQAANMASEATHSHTPAPTPEDQALALLLDHCQKRIPPKIAFERLINYADAINEQYPQGSIDGYIELLGSAPTEAVIEYVKQLPGGAQVAELNHTHQWTTDLQKLIKESQEGGEEE